MNFQTVKIPDRSRFSRPMPTLPTGGFMERLLNVRAYIRHREERSGRASTSRPVPSRSLIIAHSPEHPRSEQLRSLRDSLLAKANENHADAFFAMLSPGSREGRSQLAAELAISFAQLGGRTLLVDADLRRPCQHVLFNASNEAGLLQSLEDGCPAAMQSVQGLPKLSLLTSGGYTANPAGLLRGLRFRGLIAAWRHCFEYVVFDTPPVSEFADGLAVAAAARNVLVLSRTTATSFQALRDLRRDLEPLEACVVGAVINDF